VNTNWGLPPKKKKNFQFSTVGTVFMRESCPLSQLGIEPKYCWMYLEFVVIETKIATEVVYTLHKKRNHRFSFKYLGSFIDSTDDVLGYVIA
jgi:hypothetical protein